MQEGKLLPYIIGFILSIALTLAAFFAVLHPGFLRLGSMGVIALILAFAMAQLFVQIFFFLHIGAGREKRGELLAFLLTFGFVLIVIAASVWIMGHLNYNMMASPQQMEQYIQSQDGI